MKPYPIIPVPSHLDQKVHHNKHQVTSGCLSSHLYTCCRGLFLDQSWKFSFCMNQFPPIAKNSNTVQQHEMQHTSSALMDDFNFIYEWQSRWTFSMTVQMTFWMTVQTNVSSTIQMTFFTDSIDDLFDYIQSGTDEVAQTQNHKSDRVFWDRFSRDFVP